MTFPATGNVSLPRRKVFLFLLLLLPLQKNRSCTPGCFGSSAIGSFDSSAIGCFDSSALLKWHFQLMEMILYYPKGEYFCSSCCYCLCRIPAAVLLAALILLLY
uniref:Secreted protein n=1 Tax=Sarcocystis aucheniae TaxID=65407 RepID=A0A5P9S3N8_9APIC|nr:hypothetical protein [Sarcocystis aucheniae]